MNCALRQLGHHVDEIWSPDLGRRIQHGNLHYLLELPYAYRRLVQQRYRKQPYDVIELNQPHAYLAARDHKRRRLPGIFVNRSHGHEVRSEEALAPWRQRLRLPSGSHGRQFASRILRRLLDRQWERICRDADGFIVSCQEDADFLRQRYRVSPDRVGVVTQGVPESFLHEPAEPMTAARLTRLLYVGQLAFFKAPILLAEAVTQVLQRRQDATFTWVCSSDHHAAARALFPADLQSRIVLESWQPQAELRERLDRSGIFLFPSFFEGFGKAPLEAMARGLCVVASQVGGMRDYIRSGENGLLVPVGASDTMATAALQLMQDLPLAQRLSQAALKTARLHHWQRCAADAAAFYHQLLERKQAETSV